MPLGPAEGAPPVATEGAEVSAEPAVPVLLAEGSYCGDTHRDTGHTAAAAGAGQLWKHRTQGFTDLLFQNL